MNKVKMFFVAASLLLITAGVFAGRARFTTITIYSSKTAGAYQPLASSAVLVDLTETQSGTQAKLTPSVAAGTYGLYYFVSGTTYAPLYTNF